MDTFQDICEKKYVHNFFLEIFFMMFSESFMTLGVLKL